MLLSFPDFTGQCHQLASYYMYASVLAESGSRHQVTRCPMDLITDSSALPLFSLILFFRFISWSTDACSSWFFEPKHIGNIQFPSNHWGQGEDISEIFWNLDSKREPELPIPTKLCSEDRRICCPNAICQ